MYDTGSRVCVPHNCICLDRECFDVFVCQVLILSPTCMVMAEAARASLSLGGKRGGTGLMLSSTIVDVNRLVKYIQFGRNMLQITPS